MNPLLAFAVMYDIGIRTPVPCGNNVHGSSNVTWFCYDATYQPHFVDFYDEAKALKFVNNLKPYNHTDIFDKSIVDNQRFIINMTVYTFIKVDGEYKLIDTHKVGK